MAWIMPVVEGLANVMEIVTFIQFIEEEAIQSAALGTFLAIRSGSTRGTTLGITQCRTVCTHLKTINDNIGWMAPYSKGCFADFIASTETNIEIYEELLYAKYKQK